MGRTAKVNDYMKSQTWGERYPLIVVSWRNNWPELATFFKRNSKADIYDEYDRELL